MNTAVLLATCLGVVPVAASQTGLLSATCVFSVDRELCDWPIGFRQLLISYEYIVHAVAPDNAW